MQADHFPEKPKQPSEVGGEKEIDLESLEDADLDAELARIEEELAAEVGPKLTLHKTGEPDRTIYGKKGPKWDGSERRTAPRPAKIDDAPPAPQQTETINPPIDSAQKITPEKVLPQASDKTPAPQPERKIKPPHTNFDPRNFAFNPHYRKHGFFHSLGRKTRRLLNRVMNRVTSRGKEIPKDAPAPEPEEENPPLEFAQEEKSVKNVFNIHLQNGLKIERGKLSALKQALEEADDFAKENIIKEIKKSEGAIADLESSLPKTEGGE